MSLRQILNVTYAWTAALKGVAFIEEQLATLAAPLPAAREATTSRRARVEALENQAGIQALSQVASLPYVGGSR